MCTKIMLRAWSWRSVIWLHNGNVFDADYMLFNIKNRLLSHVLIACTDHMNSVRLTRGGVIVILLFTGRSCYKELFTVITTGLSTNRLWVHRLLLAPLCLRLVSHLKTNPLDPATRNTYVFQFPSSALKTLGVCRFLDVLHKYCFLIIASYICLKAHSSLSVESLSVST